MAQKIKNEELDSLKEYVAKENQLLTRIGAVEAEKHALLHVLAQQRDEAQKYMTQIEDTYGKISINLEDGSYEPIKEEKEAE